MDPHSSSRVAAGVARGSLSPRRVCTQADDEDGGRAARRSARYYMYRRFVSAVYGTLGYGNRIRIPPCVMEVIRDPLREPGCECELGGALANCREHGYTGFRDAGS